MPWNVERKLTAVAATSERGATALRLLPGRESDAPSPSDEQLVNAVRLGDHRVAGLLYDRVVGNVERALFRVFGRREPDHDDLMQAVFEQIVLTLSRRSYAQACSLKTWASSIAAHVALNALRSRRAERRVLDRRVLIDPQMVRAKGDVEATAGARMELDRVRQKLTTLPIEQSQTLLLHDILGHGLSEIAVMMQVPVMTAQTRLSRGRRRLIQRLGEKPPRPGPRKA
jgi:RNA polymerase sigma-70 factor (ECF subfamily)